MKTTHMKTNASKYTGVCYDKKNKRYKAYVDIGGFKFRLGNFRTEQEAISKVEFKRQQFFDPQGLYHLQHLYNLNELLQLFHIWQEQQTTKTFRTFVLESYQGIRTQGTSSSHVGGGAASLDLKKVGLGLNFNDTKGSDFLVSILTNIQILFLNGNSSLSISKALNVPIRKVKNEINNMP